MLQNEALVAKIGFDPAENEPWIASDVSRRKGGLNARWAKLLGQLQRGAPIGDRPLLSSFAVPFFSFSKETQGEQAVGGKRQEYGSLSSHKSCG